MQKEDSTEEHRPEQNRPAANEQHGDADGGPKRGPRTTTPRSARACHPLLGSGLAVRRWPGHLLRFYWLFDGFLAWAWVSAVAHHIPSPICSPSRIGGIEGCGQMLGDLA